ncbi:anti-sigma-K factor RskA [Kibdelosporangium banguiense]|uniref:Regulator of SigK n=1 Tax=Kibdelosporangium banguiense TaxID=1365924 RepID=A0ABS4TGR1_9PSEU|nr:anti-sigma factor [Kibdelosporangium banguiense]MBP2323210.1 anti-sigma-K factor RskA [Kibdelosporangium banguiense]
MNNDVHTLTGAYVLDALSEMERRAFEDHMSGCPACHQEVAELRETTARLGTATAAYPPPQLWNKVLTATVQARQLPPLAVDRVVVRPKRWGTRVAVFAAAASIVGAAGVGVGWYVSNNNLQEQLAQSQSELNKLQSVLIGPDVKVLASPIDGGGTAVALVSARQNKMVMSLVNAAPLPSNKAYQLWYVKGQGQPTSAGLIHASNGSIAANDLSPAAGATALALTVEPSNGSTSPTTNPVMQVKL